MVKVSVIIPVYNVRRYLRQCLESVISQTYQNIEILIIDDGSTDGGGRICDQFAMRDARIRVVHTDNRGLAAARNLGLENAEQEVVQSMWKGRCDGGRELSAGVLIAVRR